MTALAGRTDPAQHLAGQRHSHIAPLLQGCRIQRPYQAARSIEASIHARKQECKHVLADFELPVREELDHQGADHVLVGQVDGHGRRRRDARAQIGQGHRPLGGR